MSDRVKLPPRRLTVTETVTWEDQIWLASIGFDAQGLAREIFLKDIRNRVGSALALLADDMCILVSRLLQRGERVADLVASLDAPEHDTGPAPPTLLLLALKKAAHIEAEAGEGIRQAMEAVAARQRALAREAADA